MLADVLRSRSVDLVLTREPGGTRLGRRLREAFLETEDAVAPLAEMLLFAADRAQHVELLIKPALEAGRTVISDRYADATTAYQGAGRGFSTDTIKQITELATGGLKPDLSLFFDAEVAAAIARSSNRHDADGTRNRMDLETVDFYTRVREAYLKIAAEEPKRFRTVDANGSIHETHDNVIAIVCELLGIAARAEV